MLYLSVLDYRSDAESLRYAYEMEKDEKMKREERIRRENRNAPLLLIITCTRIEAYSIDHPIAFESIERAFSLNHIKSFDRRSSFSGKEAMRHLYILSLGIESPLFGEELILSQIKEARERAIENKSASSYLLHLSQDVISFSKKMHSSYKIRVFDKEIGTEIAGRIEKGRSVLVIGSGELSRLVASALMEKGISVTMTLRDDEKTFLLSVGAGAIPYDERHCRLKDYDVIISSSSGIYHTLDESDAPALSGKTLFDLSEPYDIPSSLHPIRLSDMDIPMPERKRIIALLSNEVDRRMDAFECDIEMREEAMAAEDFSYSVMRRLRGVIASLSLSSEKEKSLTDSLYDSIRKAYIERERKIRRR